MKVDIKEIPEYFEYRGTIITIDRLYPTFTGWYCIVYSDYDSMINDSHFGMIYHSNWSNPEKDVRDSKEKTIEFTKKEFDNPNNRWLNKNHHNFVEMT